MYCVASTCITRRWSCKDEIWLRVFKYWTWWGKRDANLSCFLIAHFPIWIQYIEAIQKHLVYALFSKGTSYKEVICMMKFGHYRFSGRFTAITFFRKNSNKKVHRSTYLSKDRTINMYFSSLLGGDMKFVSIRLLAVHRLP